MKKIHILVADDDKAIRLVLETALKRSGFDVTLTENAAELWECAQQNFADLIITDVVMPDANAFELIPKIKELLPSAAKDRLLKQKKKYIYIYINIYIYMYKRDPSPGAFG